MRFSRSIASRKNLVILAFMITALVLSLSSRASVAHPGPSLKSAPTSSCIGTTNICFNIETVDPQPGQNNYITGVDAQDNIVGAYSADNVTFNSVWASPKPASSTYPHSGFILENDIRYQSTFLQGMDNAGEAPNAHQVGYARNICANCNSVGVVYYQNGWAEVQDPNNGTCPASTQVLAMSNPRQGVGFYLKPINGTCEQQAFEFYPKTGSVGAFTYVDFSPPPPTTTESVVSSTANGINELGDVVGTETYGSPPRQAVWFYSELKYYPPFTHNGDNTFGRGIDFADRVVGDYVDSNGITHGFLVTNPVSPTFITIDYNPNSIAQPYTVVNSITIKTNPSEFGAISGWYSDGSLYHGFVGPCTTTCPNVGKSIRILKGHAKTVRPLSR